MSILNAPCVIVMQVTAFWSDKTQKAQEDFE